MSHGKLRHENNCLNCNAIVQGRFCGICGQENLQTKETIGALVRHFFEDITHFDGKFFSTLRYLMSRPGFLSSEYRRGRKATHLNPIRMYIFTSFIFFFLFYATSPFDDKLIEIQKKENIVQIDVKTLNDSIYALLSQELHQDSIVPRNMTSQKISRLRNVLRGKYTPMEEYRMKQDTIGDKDNVVERYIIEKTLNASEEYNGNFNYVAIKALDLFIHSFPQFLFTSLPLVALLLGLLYRRQKSFSLAHHGIFIIHFYIFLFINLLLIAGLNNFIAFSGFNFLSLLVMALVIYGIYYLFAGMRNFYGQSVLKTMSKYILLLIGAFMVMLLLLIIFGFIAFLKV